MRFFTEEISSTHSAESLIGILVTIIKMRMRFRWKIWGKIRNFRVSAVLQSTVSFPLKYATTVKPGGGYMVLYMDNKQTCNLALRPIGIKFTVTVSYPGNFHNILSRIEYTDFNSLMAFTGQEIEKKISLASFFL
jgi:hypothetical protein